MIHRSAPLPLTEKLNTSLCPVRNFPCCCYNWYLMIFLPFPYPSAVEKCNMWSAKSAAVSSGQCSLVTNLNLHYIYLLDHCPLSSICFWEKRLFYFFAPIFTSPLVSYCVKGDKMHPDYVCLFTTFSQRSQLAGEIPRSSHLSSGTTTALCFRLCGEAHVAALGAKVHYCSFIIHNPKILRYLCHSKMHWISKNLKHN